MSFEDFEAQIGGINIRAYEALEMVGAAEPKKLFRFELQAYASSERDQGRLWGGLSAHRLSRAEFKGLLLRISGVCLSVVGQMTPPEIRPLVVQAEAPPKPSVITWRDRLVYRVDEFFRPLTRCGYAFVRFLEAKAAIAGVEARRVGGLPS